MKLDAGLVVLCVTGLASDEDGPEFGRRHVLGAVTRFLSVPEQCGRVERDVVRGELRGLVAGGRPAGAMYGPLVEPQRQGAVFARENEAALREDRILSGGRAAVRNHHPGEARARRGDLFGVDDQAGEFVVKDFLFQAGGYASLGDVVEHAVETRVTPRPNRQGQKKGTSEQDHCQNSHRKRELWQAETRTLECDDFPIGGEASESPQDGEQEGHRHRHFQKGRQHEQQHLADMCDGNASIDQEIDEFQGAGGEQDAGENEEAQTEGQAHFAQDVAHQYSPHASES